MAADNKDIRIAELKDLVNQLTAQAKETNALLESLREELEKLRKASDEKDKTIRGLQEFVKYLQKKLYGSLRERHKIPEIDGQLSFFEEVLPPEQPLTGDADDSQSPEGIEAEYISDESLQKEKKKKTRKKHIWSRMKENRR